VCWAAAVANAVSGRALHRADLHFNRGGMLRVDGDYVAAIAEYDRGLAELAVEEGDDDEGDDEQGEEESGSVVAGCSRTRSGLNCDEWGENEFGLPADSTECARVDGLKRPWCYTDGEDWEYCDCGASGKPDLVLQYSGRENSSAARSVCVQHSGWTRHSLC